jgi:hypothetical protein
MVQLLGLCQSGRGVMEDNREILTIVLFQLFLWSEVGGDDWKRLDQQRQELLQRRGYVGVRRYSGYVLLLLLLLEQRRIFVQSVQSTNAHGLLRIKCQVWVLRAGFQTATTAS